MYSVTFDELRQLNGRISAMRNERQPFWEHWKTLSDYFLPRRYLWLQTSTPDRSRIQSRNPNILDATGTTAARTLANGMMNGITSPARPWFRLHIAGFLDDLDADSRVWLDEVERRMMLVMAESDFYNSLAVMYLDLCVFGTACSLIYDDPKKVIHCYNPALGEFFFAQDSCHKVNSVAREFFFTVEQIVGEFGLENCSQVVKDAWAFGGERRLQQYQIRHLIEPNISEKGAYARLPSGMQYTEYYWEVSQQDGTMLREKGYEDFPGMCPRWEVLANDVYGSSCPAMDALSDTIQLQHETKKKAQGLDKLISPPLIADIQLQNSPTSLFPNGITYVAGINNIGVKPAYQISLPIAELSADIQDVRQWIKTIFLNELFTSITDLQTVRSSAEINARQEEKLVQLGPVLERFESEALTPAIERVYHLMDRRGMFPDVPASLKGNTVQIQFVSILATAQSAVGTAATERWLQLIGAMSQLFPEAKAIPNIVGLVTDYGKDVGVPMKNINTPEKVQQILAAANQNQAQQEALAQSLGAARGAQVLANSDVGGGANALQIALGRG
jgi:hypothetical protein